MYADDLEWGAVGTGKRGRPPSRGKANAIRCFVLLSLGLCFLLFLNESFFSVSHGTLCGRQGTCANNLKQIGIALQTFVGHNHRLPPAAIRDKDGKPLLSWRVAILPYLEQRTLYDEFHLDEPWDSPHNKALIPFMPAIYGCPSRSRERGETSYLVFVGPGALFENPKGPRLSEITDGMDQTIAVIEGDRNVPWTKPEDLPYAPNQLLHALADVHPSGLYSLFADGSVYAFRHDKVPETVLRALITRNGGEAVEP